METHYAAWHAVNPAAELRVAPGHALPAKLPCGLCFLDDIFPASASGAKWSCFRAGGWGTLGVLVVAVLLAESFGDCPARSRALPAAGRALPACWAPRAREGCPGRTVLVPEPRTRPVPLLLLVRAAAAGSGDFTPHRDAPPVLRAAL